MLHGYSSNTTSRAYAEQLYVQYKHSNTQNFIGFVSCVIFCCEWNGNYLLNTLFTLLSIAIPILLIVVYAYMWQLVVSLVLIVLCVLFSLKMISSIASDHKNDSKWPFFSVSSFWCSYAVILPIVLIMSNMLMQRRDLMYNIVFGILGISTALSCCSSMYCNTIKYVQMKHADDKYNDKCKVVYTVAQSSWICNALVLVSMYNISSPVFSSTPFSNTTSVLWFVIPSLLVIPLMYGIPFGDDKRMNKGLKDSSSFGNEDGTDNLSEMKVLKYNHFLTRPLRFMHQLEFVARMIFTLALIVDTTSIGTSDNVIMV